MATKKAPNTLKCPDCDEEVSGPDKADVKATMERHVAKRHKKKVKK